MNEQEMKAAIKYFTPNNHPEIPLGNYHKHIQSLLDLAESYLSIQGFPEEKKSGKCYSSCSLCPYQKECPIDEKNKLIETMKLALLKKMDGITPEFLHNEYLKTVKHLHPESFNPVANKPYAELTDEQKSIDKFIAQAIKDHLTK